MRCTEFFRHWEYYRNIRNIKIDKWSPGDKPIFYYTHTEQLPWNVVCFMYVINLFGLRSVVLQEEWPEHPTNLNVFVRSRRQCPWEAAGLRPSSHFCVKQNAFLCVIRRHCDYFDSPKWISKFCLSLCFSPSEALLKCHSEWRHCPFIFPLFLLINILMSPCCCGSI